MRHTTLYVSPCFVVLLFLIATTTPSSAAVIYDEAVQGDLTDDTETGTTLLFVPGENTLFGELIPPGDPADGFQFGIPDGEALIDIIIDKTPGVEIQLSVKNRPTSDIVDEINSKFNLGDALFGPISIKDLTPVEGPAFDDLSGGLHGMRLKADLDPPYTLTFIVTPEPASLSLLTLGGIALLCRRTLSLALTCN